MPPSSMANGIASEQLVAALGSANVLSSFGAAGLSLGRVQEAIWRIQQALPNGPYAFNLIHSPNDGDLEQQTVALYLKHGVTTIEASAYLNLTPSAGLLPRRRTQAGQPGQAGGRQQDYRQSVARTCGAPVPPAAAASAAQPARAGLG